jgi:hypothetical protein
VSPFFFGFFVYFAPPLRLLQHTGGSPAGDVFVQWFVYSVAHVPRNNVVGLPTLPKPQTTPNPGVF